MKSTEGPTVGMVSSESPSFRDNFAAALKAFEKSPEALAHVNNVARMTFVEQIKLAPTNHMACTAASIASLAGSMFQLQLQLIVATPEQREAFFVASEAIPTFEDGYKHLDNAISDRLKQQVAKN